MLKQTKQVILINTPVGGGAPVTIQSMLSVDTMNRLAVKSQIDSLINEGCDIIRIAVEDEKAALLCKEYIDYSSVPLVADIHFDPKIALLCSEIGFCKIRVNPGNISAASFREIVAACKKNKTAIRLGVNSGSLEKDLLAKYGGVTASGLAESALNGIGAFEKLAFDDLIVSIKSSNVALTVAANRLLKEKCDYPLHIGITESGVGQAGIVKSAVGIGAMLLDGIGDTVRVSLTADPVGEVRAAKQILNSLGLRDSVEIVSCPTCSRCKYDLKSVAEEVSVLTAGIKSRLKIAVMGCAVNGPGEAREADFGVAGGGVGGKAVIFAKGEVLRTVAFDQVLPELKKLIDAENS